MLLWKKTPPSEQFFLESYGMMAADLVAAVAPDAFLIVGLDFAILYRQSLGRADADAFLAQFADLWIEDRPFYSQVLDEAEGPLRHIVAEHGGIVQMMDKLVIFYEEILCFLKRIVYLFPGLQPEAACQGL